MSKLQNLKAWQDEFSKNITQSKSDVKSDFELANNPRFSIYKNNTFHSLIEALKAQFPVCTLLVGVDFFEGCAKEYLTKQLPNRADVIFIGESYASFLKSFEHTASMPFLADMANLEYIRTLSLQSKETASINNELLASFDINQLQSKTLTFHPSVFLIQSNFSIFSLWKAHQPGNKLESNVINIPQNTLIFRDENRVACIELDDATYQCLIYWQSEQTLIEGIQNTILKFPEFNPTDVIEFIFSNPLITEVK